jgi:hypothetical protein
MLETIVTTTLIGIGSFLFYKFFGIKLIQWRELKDELMATTVEFGHFYSIPNKEGILTAKDLYDKVQQKLRRMAGEIITLPNIPFYKFWVRIHLLPSKKMIEEVSGVLIGWSNSLVKTDWQNNHRELFIEELKKHLNLPNAYEQLREIQKLEWENDKKH